MTVDLPDPVLPMTAVVLPAGAVKLTWSSTGSLSGLYEKLTSSKASSTPSACAAIACSSASRGCAGSLTENEVSSTSSMRPAATSARGSITETMPIMRKLMMMTMA